MLKVAVDNGGDRIPTPGHFPEPIFFTTLLFPHVWQLQQGRADEKRQGSAARGPHGLTQAGKKFFLTSRFWEHRGMQCCGGK